MTKIIGYIVVIEESGVGELTKEPLLESEKTWPHAGVLLDGTDATLFASNYRAMEAIKRTVNYATVTKKENWPERAAYRIVPVVSL